MSFIIIKNSIKFDIGINEDDIKINTYGKKIEIKTAGTSYRKY